MCLHRNLLKTVYMFQSPDSLIRLDLSMFIFSKSLFMVLSSLLVLGFNGSLLFSIGSTSLEVTVVRLFIGDIVRLVLIMSFLVWF